MGGGQVGGLNILPKKRWHVRTRDNINRVRRDEAKAAAEEKARQERAALAEKEARTQLLRTKARCREREKETDLFSQPSTSAVTCDKSGHVNFFAELEEQERTFGVNKDYEEEKRKEKEQEEIKVGLLRFLGDGSVEASKQKPWYEVIPDRSSKSVKLNSSKNEVPAASGSSLSGKQIFTVHKAASFINQNSSGGSNKLKAASRPRVKECRRSKLAVSSKKRRHRSSSSSSAHSSSKSPKKQRHRSRKYSSLLSSSSSSESEWTSNPENGVSSSDDESSRYPSKRKDVGKAAQLSKTDILRAQRLKREEQERLKAQQLLKRLKGEIEPETTVASTSASAQKYNSQFNPDICRQNQPRNSRTVFA